MPKKTSIIIFFLGAYFMTSCYATNAHKPQRIAGFVNWAVYKYQIQGHDVCYALSVPRRAMPVTAHHGKVYFLVSRRPNAKLANGFEPQFLAGYNLKPGTQLVVNVITKGKKSRDFHMYVRGKTAWVKRNTDEQQLVAQMKTGALLNIEAQSAHGTKTSYSYLLEGLGQALEVLGKCSENL